MFILKQKFASKKINKYMQHELHLRMVLWCLYTYRKYTSQKK